METVMSLEMVVFMIYPVVVIVTAAAPPDKKERRNESYELQKQEHVGQLVDGTIP